MGLMSKIYQQSINIKKTQEKKNGQKTWIDIFSNKTYPHPKVPEKMLNITKHQGNANQNHNKVSSRTCHYSYYQKMRDNKCSWGCREMRTLEHCWWESNLVQSWVRSPSRVQLFATPWTAALQASLPLTISQNLPKFMSNALVQPLWKTGAATIANSREVPQKIKIWWFLLYNIEELSAPPPC